MFSEKHFAALRVFLRTMQWSTFGSRRRAIRETLADTDLQHLLLARIQERFGDLPDTILEILQFLLDHADEILALVLEIINLAQPWLSTRAGTRMANEAAPLNASAPDDVVLWQGKQWKAKSVSNAADGRTLLELQPA